MRRRRRADTPIRNPRSGLVESHRVDQPATVHGQVVAVGPEQGHDAAVLVQLLARPGVQVDAWRVGAGVDGEESFAGFSAAIPSTGVRQQHSFYFQTHVMVFVVLAKSFKNVMCFRMCFFLCYVSDQTRK